MLLASGIALVVPLAIRALVDAAIGERPDALGFLGDGITAERRLVLGALLLVGLSLGRALVSFVQRYGTAWVGRTAATDLRRDLFDHLLGSELAFHDRASVGQLMTRVTDDTEQVRQFAATGVAELFNIAVLVVGTAVLLFTIDPVLAPIALAVVPVVAALGLWGARLLHPRFVALQQTRGGLSAQLQEALTGVRVVQAFSAEPRTVERYAADNEVVFERRLGLARIFTSIFPAMGALLGLTTAAVLAVGGQRVADGTTTVGTIVAFASYIVLLGQPVRRLGFLLNLAARASASASRVFDLMDREPTMAEVEAAARATLPEPVAGRVAWEGVDFAFDPAGAPVLQDIDVTIRPGEHVAIVGRSGSGKSALVSLLTRLYDPTDGQVTLDGVDLADVALEDVREAVASVEQEAFLFSATVAANIAFARPDASAAEIEEAARVAGAAGFVEALPEGYETLVGERGVTLSGGQRQRVALARALLIGAPVLVLDDAVSAVDARTEHAIRATLAEGGGRRTVISVAQRLSTILAADRIVMLVDGRVAETGTHDELMTTEGPYAELFRTTVAALTGEPAPVLTGSRR